MTTYIGNEGKVKLGSDAIAEVTSFSITVSAATADKSALGDAWDSHHVGSKSWTAQIDCYLDQTDADGQASLSAGSEIELLNLYAASDAAGRKYFSGAATVTQVTLQASRNQTVTYSMQVQGNGALSEATV